MALTDVSFTDKVASAGAPGSGVSVFVAADANDLKRGVNEINAELIGNNADVFVSKDFTNSAETLDGIVISSGTTPTITGGQLVFVPTTGGQALCFEYGSGGRSEDVDLVDVFIDIEINATDYVKLQPMWTNDGTVIEIEATGVYHYRFRRLGTESNDKLNRFTVSTVDSGGGTIKLNKIQIKRAVDARNTETELIEGLGAESNWPTFSSSSRDRLGIVKGNEATTNQDTPTVIGVRAKLNHVGYYSSDSLGPFGCASSKHGVVYGAEANGGGWRTTSIGGAAYAMGQSSTALGCGAVTLRSHGVALGRGTYVPDAAVIDDVDTVISGTDIFFENGWGHKFNTPISEISISDKTPSSTTKVLHGQDAFDARRPAWDNSTDYVATSATVASTVQHNDVVYKAHAVSGPSSSVVEPGVTSGWADYWIELEPVPSAGDGSGVPSDYNVAGGHLRLAAGRSTGTGTGGTAGIQICDGTNLGQNTKQALTDGFVVDSDYGGAETPLKIREDDGTMLRVYLGAADSAGTGYRTLRVLN